MLESDMIVILWNKEFQVIIPVPGEPCRKMLKGGEPYEYR
jgi:hypothetical protein